MPPLSPTRGTAVPELLRPSGLRRLTSGTEPQPGDLEMRRCQASAALQGSSLTILQPADQHFSASVTSQELGKKKTIGKLSDWESSVPRHPGGAAQSGNILNDGDGNIKTGKKMK